MKRATLLPALFGLTALVFSISSAQATTFFEEKFECPIGGEKFKANVVVSNSSFGQRPDGKRYSPLPVYPVVECPENGFLLFKDEFTDPELATLEAAINTEEFKNLRLSETQHYRVWWLKKQIGSPLTSQISSLLQASWETDHDIHRKIRYQADFVNLVMKLDRAEETASDWFWFNLRAVNALRELGYFEEGLRHIDFVMSPEHLPQDLEKREDAQFYAGELRALLEQQNAYMEPANLIPDHTAKFRCIAPTAPLTEAETQACGGEGVQTAIAEFTFKPKGGKKLSGEAAVRAAVLQSRGEASTH